MSTRLRVFGSYAQSVADSTNCEATARMDNVAVCSNNPPGHCPPLHIDLCPRRARVSIYVLSSCLLFVLYTERAHAIGESATGITPGFVAPVRARGCGKVAAEWVADWCMVARGGAW